MVFLGLLCGWMALCELKKKSRNIAMEEPMFQCQEEQWSLESILCAITDYSEHLF